MIVIEILFAILVWLCILAGIGAVVAEFVGLVFPPGSLGFLTTTGVVLLLIVYLIFGPKRRHSEQEDKRGTRSPTSEEFERREQERVEQQHERRAEEERRARQRWEQYHTYMRVEQTDGMTGAQFEDFVMTLLARSGFENMRKTPSGRDQGADLLCVSGDGRKVVIQAKRWKGAVGNSAIQEVLGAMLFYDCEAAYVVTNSTFTDSARALARKDSRIHLIGRTELSAMLRQYVRKQEVPEFDRDQYDKYVRDWRPR